MCDVCSLQENVAKVWDVSEPSRSRILFTIEAPGEVSQLLWVPWMDRWLSMSDDGTFLLWTPVGELAYRFAYNGGPVQAALVDEEQKLVLAAMKDAKMRIFDLEDPVPKARYASYPDVERPCLYTSVGSTKCGNNRNLRKIHVGRSTLRSSRTHQRVVHCTLCHSPHKYGWPWRNIVSQSCGLRHLTLGVLSRDSLLKS
jgi:hypothetical protein